MPRDDARHAAGTRWVDHVPDQLPVPPREVAGQLDLDRSDALGNVDAEALDGGRVRLAPEIDGPEGSGDGSGPVGVAAGWDEPEPWDVGLSSGADRRSPAADRRIQVIVDTAVVAVCVLFVFLQLGPRNLLADTTPAGGDMGAHVWGPAYLRDHLLPHFQLSGWSPDWYDGFPAYLFYMVVPSLLIVLLDIGIQGPLVVLPLAVAVAAGVAAVRQRAKPRRRWILLAVAAVALLCIGLPYGVAFKLVSISGVVSLPVSAYLFGRLSGLSFPTPAALAAATLPFLFYRGFTIYGGNIPSTLAGEFAFAMSLSIGLVYLGVLFRGFETGRYRALAAVLLALTGLCHLIPAFWVLGATVVAVLVRSRPTTQKLTHPALVVGGVGAALATIGALGRINGWAHFEILVAVGVLAFGAAVVMRLAYSQTVRWLAPVMVVGGLLSAFWVLPFLLRRAYLNDMGWEKLPYPDPETGRIDFWDWLQHLLPAATPDADLRWAFALAAVGLGLSLALRLRAGIFLGAVAVATGVAFWVLPQGRLWNARVLPFYYLVVILLAGLALVEGARLVAELIEPRRRPGTWFGSGAVAGVLVVSLLYVGLPMGVIPGSEHLAQGGYGWPDFSPVQFQSSPESFVPGWANWNYTGYEGKDSYREYYEVVQTMDRLGDDRGCGMAMWEYQRELDRYGTPMALMLLPYWTDGCIGSMEGLYFEASATTPYHFLMQTELSAAPSAAQRDMPYGGFDIARGVQHMQLMGVRYYMATTQQAIQAANTQPALTQIATSGPWVIYEVADSEVVTGLINEPAVIEGAGDHQTDWLEEPRDTSGRFFGPSIQWFLEPQRWPILVAADGPPSWQRIGMTDDVLDQPEERPVPLVQVSNIDTESDPEQISFDVDRVGSPVLVKQSYFPNWHAEGALGPWRVAPNLMVVVPTQNHVVLSYENTSVEWVSYALTFVGLIGLLLLARRGVYRFRAPSATAAASSSGAPVDGESAVSSAEAPAVVSAAGSTTMSTGPPPDD